MADIPNTEHAFGTPRTNRPSPTIVQEGYMNQWHARAEYRPGEGWCTLVFAFELPSVRLGLDRQFRPTKPSSEFIERVKVDEPEWLAEYEQLSD